MVKYYIKKPILYTLQKATDIFSTYKRFIIVLLIFMSTETCTGKCSDLSVSHTTSEKSNFHAAIHYDIVVDNRATTLSNVITDIFAGTQGSEGENLDFSFAGSAAIGYSIGNVKLECGLVFFRIMKENIKGGSIKKIRLSTRIGVINALYNYNISDTPLSLYVGIGAGFGMMESESTFDITDKLGITAAQQGKFGFSYSFTPKVNAFFGYSKIRIITINRDLAINVVDTFSYNRRSNIEIGISYNF